MFDLHNHLLPGIDDGAEDLHETLRMAKVGWDDGIRTFVVTPHLFWDHRENHWTLVKQLATQAQEFLEEHGVLLRIVPGTEIPTREASLHVLREGRLPTLGNSRCILLEPPFGHLPPNMDKFVGAFLDAGYQILLAHPERCRDLQDRPERLNDFFPSHMALQITSHSLTGVMGDRAQETAQIYLSGNRPMILSSDAHSSGHRAPVLSEGVKLAAKFVGEEYARQMVTDLPHALLEDRPVWPPARF